MLRIEFLRLTSYGAAVDALVEGGGINDLVDGFKTSFAGRYIPSFSIEEHSSIPNPETIRFRAVIHWRLSKDSFRIRDLRLRGEVDEYWINSPPPKPYVNESPYFFILQALSRIYVKLGYLMLTDSVSVLRSDGTAALLLGYPHTGKSTLLALSIAHGLTPLTTENTLLRVGGGEAFIIGGTHVLVFDPVISKLYGIRVRYGELTRHGYAVVDLSRDFPGRDEALRKGVKISDIYLLYLSFSSKGFDLKEVKGRKVVKTLWHFASSIIRGTDYYDPSPPDLVTPEVNEALASRVREVARGYEGRMYEVFGSHDEVFRRLILKS